MPVSNVDCFVREMRDAETTASLDSIFVRGCEVAMDLNNAEVMIESLLERHTEAKIRIEWQSKTAEDIKKSVFWLANELCEKLRCSGVSKYLTSDQNRHLSDAYTHAGRCMSCLGKFTGDHG